jgi:hypothetical protein
MDVQGAGSLAPPDAPATWRSNFDQVRVGGNEAPGIERGRRVVLDPELDRMCHVFAGD